MTFENAMRWYHFDPFTHISREQATVGALRKAAEGHDVSIQALSHHKQDSSLGALRCRHNWTGPPPLRSKSASSI